VSCSYQVVKRVTMCAFVLIQYQSVTDGRTDGQTSHNNNPIAFCMLTRENKTDELIFHQWDDIIWEFNNHNNKHSHKMNL